VKKDSHMPWSATKRVFIGYISPRSVCGEKGLFVKSVQELSERLGLRKAGREFKGACPICGGDDRFHIKESQNGGLLVYCRRGCNYSQIMRELENRGLVEKTAYNAPRYRYQDLDFADSLVTVVAGNLEKKFKFHAADIQTIAALIPRVDPERQELLKAALNRVKAQVNGEQ
jgi:hypothetical protein